MPFDLLQVIRSFFSFVLTVALVTSRGTKLGEIFGSRKKRPALLLRGCAGAAGMTLFYFGVLQLTMADAVSILKQRAHSALP